MKQQRLEKYSERFDNDKSPIGNPETWGKRVLTEEDIFNQRDIDAVTDYINRETSKQETLEEVAERIYPDCNNVIRQMAKETFIKGAKWQQEQEKNKYSEEEVIQLVSDWTDYRMSEDIKSKVTFKKWFEQFKNK